MDKWTNGIIRKPGTRETKSSTAPLEQLFYHAPLPSSDWIRLLEIGGTIDDTKLSYSIRSVPLSRAAAIGYDALSYTWGEGHIRSKVYIDGRAFYIGQNLYEFLQELHCLRWKGLLWVDAISINQMNLHERNSQVEMMANIYRSARVVRVWLGTGNYRLRYFFHRPLIQEFQSSPAQLSSECVDFVRLLSSCKYWTRAWIVQELASATTQTIHLHYADQSLPLYDLWDLLLDADGFKTWYAEGAHQVAQIKPMLNILRRVDTSYPQLQLFESIIHDFSHLACSEPRDHIYAFKALYQDKVGDRLPVDYGISISELMSKALDCCETTTNLHYLFTMLQTWRITQPDDAVDTERLIFARLCPQLSTVFQLPGLQLPSLFYLSEAESLLGPQLKLALLSCNPKSTSLRRKSVFLRAEAADALKQSQVDAWSIIILEVQYDFLFPALRTAEGWDDKLAGHGGIAIVTVSDSQNLATLPHLGVWVDCTQAMSRPNHRDRGSFERVLAQLKVSWTVLERGLRGATFSRSKATEISVGFSLLSWLALHQSIQDTTREAHNT